jgi:hypothetical protein
MGDDMKLVENWRKAWKWFSVQIALVGLAVQGAVLAFPDLKSWLGDTATHCVGLLILVGLIGGRLVDQKKPEAEQ